MEAGVSYPPSDIALYAIKDEKRMELWARSTPRDKFKMVHSYGIRAASGIRGPKLQQGDRQVPEGIYQISRLNPHSNYHLSMKVNYPNEFDLDHAEYDGRTGSIFAQSARVDSRVVPAYHRSGISSDRRETTEGESGASHASPCTSSP